MGQAIAKSAAAAQATGREIELVGKTELEELQTRLVELEVQYQEAVVLLRLVRSKASRFAGSGNPGRRAAGLDILDTLGVRA